MLKNTEFTGFFQGSIKKVVSFKIFKNRIIFNRTPPTPQFGAEWFLFCTRISRNFEFFIFFGFRKALNAHNSKKRGLTYLTFLKGPGSYEKSFFKIV